MAVQRGDRDRSWADELNRRGYWHEWQLNAPQGVLSFEWVNNRDCLVAGVMLFTWEAGVAL